MPLLQGAQYIYVVTYYDQGASEVGERGTIGVYDCGHQAKRKAENWVYEACRERVDEYNPPLGVDGDRVGPRQDWHRQEIEGNDYWSVSLSDERDESFTGSVERHLVRMVGNDISRSGRNRLIRGRRTRLTSRTLNTSGELAEKATKQGEAGGGENKDISQRCTCR